MSSTPPNYPDGVMRHVEFHPWAAAIGRLEQGSANSQDQLRELKRSVEDMPVRINQGLDRLRGEVYQALGEHEKRSKEMLLAQTSTIQQLISDAQRREQRQYLLFAVTIAASFIATFSAKPSAEELRSIQSAVSVGAAVIEKMPH